VNVTERHSARRRTPRAEYFERWEKHFEEQLGVVSAPPRSPPAAPPPEPVVPHEPPQETQAAVVSAPALAPAAPPAPEAAPLPPVVHEASAKPADAVKRPRWVVRAPRKATQPLPPKKPASGPARVRSNPPSVRAVLEALRRAPFTDADPHFVEAAAILQRAAGRR
jgi:hypothetical protein